MGWRSRSLALLHLLLVDGGPTYAASGLVRDLQLRVDWHQADIQLRPDAEEGHFWGAYISRYLSVHNCCRSPPPPRTVPIPAGRHSWILAAILLVHQACSSGHRAVDRELGSRLRKAWTTPGDKGGRGLLGALGRPAVCLTRPER